MHTRVSCTEANRGQRVSSLYFFSDSFEVVSLHEPGSSIFSVRLDVREPQKSSFFYTSWGLSYMGRQMSGPQVQVPQLGS